MADQTLPASRFAEREFRVGHVFSRALSVFGEHFLAFLLVTGIASLPPILIPHPAPLGPRAINPFQNFDSIFAALLSIVLATLAQAIVVYGAFEVMRGRPIELGESAKVGLRRFFPIVGLATLVSVLIGLASVLLFVPGIMLYTMWFVATPACVVERLGVLGSMERSRELTKGKRWRIFCLALLVLVPALMIGGIVGGAAVAGGAATLNDALASTVGKIAKLGWNAIWTAFYNIMVVVAYHDLRVAQEGVDTDQIAAVFD